MNPTIPGPIKTGDTAYIISPSAGIMPFAEQRVKRATKNLEALGLKVKIARYAADNAGYVSASVEHRLADIHAAFEDQSCSLIMAAIGGNHSNQLIDQLDYSLIKNNPKTFVGYSDNSVLHLAMLSQANLQTYYGPCFLNQFGEHPEPLAYTIADFTKVVIKKQFQKTYKPSEKYTDEVLDWFSEADTTRPRVMYANRPISWWRDGKAEGWALPAAIPSINHVLGTRYLPDCSGAILFLDIPEGNSMREGMSISDVDAWLTDLVNADVFKKINGLVIGRPYHYSLEQTEELYRTIDRIASEFDDKPILFNVDFGHTDPMITIPYGSRVALDSNKNQLDFIN